MLEAVRLHQQVGKTNGRQLVVAFVQHFLRFGIDESVHVAFLTHGDGSNLRLILTGSKPIAKRRSARSTRLKKLRDFYLSNCFL